MTFRSLQALRLFDAVARHHSFTAASEELHLTKGAISYQIDRLEDELGFTVFTRSRKGIALTERGKSLWHMSQVHLQRLERDINQLKNTADSRVTVGMTTYFGSRWLSPRLMGFTRQYPNFGLRLTTISGPIDLHNESMDAAIRWGTGHWPDMVTELLLASPAFPTAGRQIAQQLDTKGLRQILDEAPLLHDREDSRAWEDWHQTAGLEYRPNRDDLVIEDPSVRVQAVIDGQGIALNDSLVANELQEHKLFSISPIQISEYGYYLVYPRGGAIKPSVKIFRDWIVEEAGNIT